MWYTGGWEPIAIAMAYSDDSGLTWTRDGSAPLIGGGGSGVTGNAAHTGLWIEPDLPATTLHISFASPGVAPLRRATSTDGGLTWGGVVTLLTATGWEVGDYGNTACVKKDGTWHLLYEAWTGSTWKIGYATSMDGVTFTRQNGGNPLASLQIGAGMYGGCDLHLMDDGVTWELFYHASTSGIAPTRIYRATSTDLINWTLAGMVLDMGLSYEVDQVADPAVVTIGGTRYMFYAGMDNPHQAGKINRAVFTAS